MGLLMCASVFFAVVRPHRALLASYLTSASLVLTCTVALMAMLCRLETVDQSAVDDFGMFVSVTMMLIKVYTVAYPYAEAWLVMRNNSSTVSGSEPNKDSFSGLTESFASIGRGSPESFSS
ncbi:membrane-associated protein, putative, partial [Bodo saltans]